MISNQSPEMDLSRRALAMLRNLRVQGLEQVELAAWGDGLILRGAAPTPTARKTIREACRSVAGVRWVDDQLAG